MSPETPDELLTAARRAEQEFTRRTERVYNIAFAILDRTGSGVLPAHLALAVHDATDAREAWIQAVDTYCRGGRS